MHAHRKTLLSFAPWVGLLLLVPSLAHADTIRITSGFLVMSVGPFDLIGDSHGFRLFGNAYQGGHGPNAFAFCPGELCNPGEVVLYQHAANGLDLPASATFEGIAYEDVNTLSGPAFAEIGFSGTVPLPAAGSDTAVLRTPFTMQGNFVVQGVSDNHTLVGSGVMTSRWTAGSDETGAPIWDLTSARYDFLGASPVPEPTTLLLLGAGGTVAAWRRRKNSRNA